MKVRWSQLVYRRPGSDNATGLATVYTSQDGDLCRFQESSRHQDVSVGYLALVAMTPALEEELDMWVELDDTQLARDQSLWEGSTVSRPQISWWQSLRIRMQSMLGSTS